MAAYSSSLACSRFTVAVLSSTSQYVNNVQPDASESLGTLPLQTYTLSSTQPFTVDCSADDLHVRGDLHHLLPRHHRASSSGLA